MEHGSTIGVIFDMDGVLVDSYRAHFASWRQVARQHGLEMTEQQFAATFGRTSREIIRQLWPGRFDDGQVTKLDQDKEAAYRDILRRDFPAMRGAGELLALLHAAGVRMAIGSSGPMENVQLTKERLPNGQRISAIVHGGEVNHGKPDPEVFLTAAKKLQLPPSQCAVVEDARVGLEAARCAGMAAIGLVGTATRQQLQPLADLVIDSLSDLSPQIVRHMVNTLGRT